MRRRVPRYGAYVLERRTDSSGSLDRMSRRTSVKPACDSACGGAVTGQQAVCSVRRASRPRQDERAQHTTYRLQLELGGAAHIDVGRESRANAAPDGVHIHVEGLTRGAVGNGLRSREGRTRHTRTHKVAGKEKAEPQARESSQAGTLKVTGRVDRAEACTRGGLGRGGAGRRGKSRRRQRRRRRRGQRWCGIDWTEVQF